MLEDTANDDNDNLLPCLCSIFRGRKTHPNSSYAMVLSPPMIWDSYNLWYFAPCLADNMYIWMFSRGNCFPTVEERDCIGKHWKSKNILIRGFRGRADCAIPWQWWSQRRKVINSDEEWERNDGENCDLLLRLLFPERKLWILFTERKLTRSN